MNEWIDEQMDGWIYRYLDKRMNESVDIATVWTLDNNVSMQIVNNSVPKICCDHWKSSI